MKLWRTVVDGSNRVDVDITTLAGNIESIVSNVLTTLFQIILIVFKKIVPWLLPLGPAIAIYLAIEPVLRVLPYHHLLAIAIASGFEGMGIVIAHTAIRASQWNNSRLKTDEPVDAKLATRLLWGYILSGASITLIIKLIPSSAYYVFAAFFFLSAMMNTIMGINGRLETLERDKRKNAVLRQEKRGLNAEIKVAMERLAALTAEFEKTQAEARALTETVARLKAQKRQLEAQKLTPSRSEKPVSADDPPGFSPETIERAREVYNRFTAEGRKRFGAALGREVGVNDRNGRKLVEYFRSLNGALNGEEGQS